MKRSIALGAFLLALAALLAALCRAAGTEPVSFSWEDRLRGDAIVLLGEVHDNPVQHGLRLEVLRRAFEEGWRPAIAMEQFDREHQSDIERAPPGIPRKKAPKLRALDRLLLGLGAMLVLEVAVAIRPSTLLRFHRALIRRKYQWLFCAKTRRRPGRKGPSKELIAAILEIKRLNPRFGCPRIAQQISHAFGLEIDKDVVRRILANHNLPKSGGIRSVVAFGHR